MANTTNLGIPKHPSTWTELHPGQGPEEMVNAALDNLDAQLLNVVAPLASPVFTSSKALAGAHGEQWVSGQATESITLSTSGLTTDSSANLLPANSIIEAVVARVTTAITVTTNWAVGDGTVSNRFAAANATLAAGTTEVGLKHVDQTGTSGPIQSAAAKLRITCTGSNPGAGVVRVTVFYRQFVAPTS